MSAQVVVSWSGGKDSCLALRELQRSGRFEIVSLLTAITIDDDRIGMHGVCRGLLEQQAAMIDLPLHTIGISRGASNAEYEARMGEALSGFRGRGVETVVFGDLFLGDIRRYRERLLERFEMKCLFPLWRRDTAQLIGEFIAAGFQAIVTCVDTAQLDASFAGRLIDESFVSELPPSVDPCGENGEFHTFVFAGPNFSAPVSFSRGEIVARDGFCFYDLLPL